MEDARAEPFVGGGTADVLSTYGEALALGLWLPCDQAHFFDSIADNKHIRDDLDKNPLLTLKGEMRRTFQGSVFRRLYEVLGAWGYDLALPLYPLARLQYLHKTDPDGVIFYSRKGPRSPTSPQPKSYLENLTLIVDSQGFYLWILPGLKKEYYNAAQDHLADHIVEAFGGHYYSRFLGLRKIKLGQSVRWEQKNARIQSKSTSTTASEFSPFFNLI
jgi:hypothetical protein